MGFYFSPGSWINGIACCVALLYNGTKMQQSNRR